MPGLAFLRRLYEHAAPTSLNVLAVTLRALNFLRIVRRNRLHLAEFLFAAQAHIFVDRHGDLPAVWTRPCSILLLPAPGS